MGWKLAAEIFRKYFDFQIEHTEIKKSSKSSKYRFQRFHGHGKCWPFQLMLDEWYYSTPKVHPKTICKRLVTPLFCKQKRQFLILFFNFFSISLNTHFHFTNTNITHTGITITYIFNATRKNRMAILTGDVFRKMLYNLWPNYQMRSKK